MSSGGSIENLWDTHDGWLPQEHKHRNNLDDLWRRLIQIWEELDQNEVRRIILNMGCLCQDVIRARDGNTTDNLVPFFTL